MIPITYSLGSSCPSSLAKAPAVDGTAGATPLPTLPDRHTFYVETLCEFGGLAELVEHLLALPGLTLARFGISRECH